MKTYIREKCIYYFDLLDADLSDEKIEVTEEEYANFQETMERFKYWQKKIREKLCVD